MSIDRHMQGPLYRQIERILRQELGATERPPRYTESGLMARFGVSRFTVRQALALLSQEGLIERRHRSGTFRRSRQPIEQPLSGVYSFARSMEELGVTAASTVLSLRRGLPSAGVQQQLRLEPGAQVVDLVRLREAEGEPVMLETIRIPADLVPGFEELPVSGSVYALLDSHYGIQVTTARESLRPIVLDAVQARFLKAKRGAAAFFVERVSFQNDRPVEVRHNVIRGDRYLFSVQLKAAAQTLTER